MTIVVLAIVKVSVPAAPPPVLLVTSAASSQIPCLTRCLSIAMIMPAKERVISTVTMLINAAARSFPGFGTTGDNTARKREIAAFFAQTSHETTGGWPTAPDGPYAWGYCFLREQGNPGDYCTPSSQWPCAPGRKYFGRGPIQISYNYNYGPCGRAIGVDLLNNPDLVATDPVISFKSAIWFWMTPQSPKPSCHDVIIGRWQPSGADRAANRLPGFGVITNIINGGSECGHGNDNRVQDRIGFYRILPNFGVSPGDNLDCGNQRSFGN
ncbi:Chitinase 1 [Datura stramonium]|uniref:chitinase n=1 Tax=Datura stramonium TaxID=4076 RepID=A0ABS8VAG9_DATST|nr:Chitinase 1 [Datura stramonium]